MKSALKTHNLELLRSTLENPETPVNRQFRLHTEEDHDYFDHYETALHIATMSEGTEMLEALLARPDIDLNVRNGEAGMVRIIFSAYYKLMFTAFSRKSYYFQPKGMSTQH